LLNNNYRKTGGCDIQETYDGLIIWGVDNDKLAAKVGRRLEENPPKGIKIIKYPGDTNSPGWYEELEQYMYVEDAIAALEKAYSREHIQKLHDMDGVYVRKIYDWERNLLRNYKAKFSIELHDTLTRRGYREKDCNKKRELIDIGLLIPSFNRKMFHLLDDYCRATKPTLVEKYNIEHFSASSRLLGTAPYHQVVVEIDQDPLWCNINKATEDASDSISELSQFMRAEYPKLWKKNK